MSPNESSEDVFDVFVSFNEKQRNWVKSVLIPRLKKADLKVIWENDWPLGSDIHRNICEATQKSRHTLAVISPGWLESEWCELERSLCFNSDPAGSQRKLVAVVREKCGDEIMRQKDLNRLVYGSLEDDANEADWERLIKSLRRVDECAQVRLARLTELVRSNVGIRNAVTDNRTLLQKCLRQIKMLTAIKDLHDKTQEYESGLKTFNLPEATADPNNAELWGGVQTQCSSLLLTPAVALQTAYEEHYEFLDKCGLETLIDEIKAFHESLFPQFRESIAALKAAVQRRISKVLPSLNNQIVDTKKNLDLNELSRKVQELLSTVETSKLAEEDQKTLESIQEQARHLQELAEKLSHYVEAHDRVQNLTGELEGMDVVKDFPALPNFNLKWRIIKNSLRNTGKTDIREELPIVNLVKQIGDEHDGNCQLHRLKNLLAQLQSTAVSCFSAIDKALLVLCQHEIGVIAESISALLDGVSDERLDT
jgi:hypothetical protein